jgi:hypothetical protein
VPDSNPPPIQIEQISEAMKAIWFCTGLLDARVRPMDTMNLPDAVEQLIAAYEGVNTKYAFPTLLQALTALSSAVPPVDQETIGRLVDVMTDDPEDRAELKRAARAPQTWRTVIDTIGASPLAYTDDCDVVDVMVDGDDAVFLYTGFTTQAPYNALTGWLDPNDWHHRSPVLFREVTPAGRHMTESWGPYDFWHETFKEQATPFANNTVVTNMLACNHAELRGGGFAITSYDLSGDDNEVLVDCGYLMIRHLGANQAASFVKMIGFENPAQNDLVWKLKHMWVSLIRAVAEGDAENRSSGQPTMGDAKNVPDDQTSVTELVRGWVDASTSCIQASGNLAGNLIGGFVGPSFGWDDFRRTVTGYWSDIAQHYVSAWSATQGSVARMSGNDQTTASRAQLMMGPSTATSWVAIEPDVSVGTPIQFGEMRCISDTRIVIPPNRIVGQVVADQNERLIALRANSQGLRRGAYVGSAEVGNRSVPTFVYVTGATVKAP